ncbi:nitroreductase family protein [Microbulbifer agarilyticus]|uniref:nitroreductase family protein n=1 Tax=Microbulbifer agarilyticus TaxID=260552 RepID=UPI001C96C8E4|nr:nitroreductase family protein [Microbulbifer agarilyticus]MBY6190022.1 nitroreductase family protein [Microbulbifer agarilyticus]MCA0892513.1 nitroreductase family protein [Microbulbifer agarilyticus]
MAEAEEFIPLQFEQLDDATKAARAKAFYEQMKQRRSVRNFSSAPVPRAVIEDAVRTAGSAPSGANMQPWHFCVVESEAVKKEIRIAAEAEEREFYERRASEEWLDALAPLGTDAHKPFLETAPYLIVIFLKKFSQGEAGEQLKNYYTSESVGIATGMLLAALHNAGVATLTHTPSPMKFLNQILVRPSDERPYMIVVAGLPEDGAEVPAIQKKPLEEIAEFI